MFFNHINMIFKIPQLKEMLSELSFDTNNVLCDNISLSLKLEQLLSIEDGNRVFPKCCSVLNEISQTCNACDCNLCNFPNREELYSDVSRGHLENAPKVMLGEVLDCNPNSYETIYKVLKNLLDQGHVGELRKWIRVGFDVVTYHIASELINSTTQWKNCLEMFFSNIKIRALQIETFR